VQSLRAASDEALPPLRVVPLAPRSRTALRAVAAAVGVAAAASFLTIVQPFGPRGTRAKGSGFALSMYVDHRGEVRRVGSGEAVAPGDAVRFAVSTPAEAYVAVLSLDAKGHASIYFPQGGRAQPVPRGVDVPLPLGTRLDDTVGEERIVGIFCQSAVELEPLRAHLERGALVLPDGCQETRWSFVKR
jgi:hypothetical protein